MNSFRRFWPRRRPRARLTPRRFKRTLDIDPHTATVAELAAATKAAGISVPSGMHADDRDEWLNLLLATRVEPQLGRDRPEILYHYPASQASLAKVATTDAGYEVAERFELYYRGIELANGFHELGDAAELRRRFEEVNAARVADGRAALRFPRVCWPRWSMVCRRCTGVRAGLRSAGDAGAASRVDRRSDGVSTKRQR